MLKELLSKDYQNFYINQEGIICGVVTPKEIWKITDPQELLKSLNLKLENLKKMGNFKAQLQDKVSKRIVRLERTIKKQVS